MREKSLKQKLIGLVLLAVGGAQAVVALLSLWGEAERFATNKSELLLTQARVVAAAVSNATAAHDRQGVYAALRVAARLPDIKFIAVEDLAGDRIADLGAAEMLTSDLAISEGRPLAVLDLLRTQSFSLRAPVVQGGVKAGEVVLIGDASDLKTNLRAGLLTTAAASALALALALLVAMRLQAAVARPLTGLVRGMQSVAVSHDYALTLPHSEVREVRILIEGFNGMLSEIRDRDRRIARSYADLENQVLARTIDLEAAKAAAESAKLSADEANAHKSEFLATMSHEIRTPLNGMLVMAELLAQSSLPPAAKRRATVISRSGKSLLAIINDVLDFAKIEAGKLELERTPLDIAELVMSVLDLFAERARSKGLDLAAIISPRTPQTIVGDPVRLTQIITNLVNNAVKFTDRGGICVRLGPLDGSARLRIAVEDTGIGVPHDKIETIFGLFSQSDMSTTRKYGGTGLGLAICRRLVRAMGSDIAVASEIGQGARFSFELGIDGYELAPPPATLRWDGPPVLVAVAGDLTREALARGFEDARARIVIAADIALADEGQFVIADRSVAAEDLLRARQRGARIIGLDQNGESELAFPSAETCISWPVSAREIGALARAMLEGGPFQPLAQVPGDDFAKCFAGFSALVADDNEVNQEVAKQALERLGMRVKIVSDGAMALAACAETMFDIVFMDGSMPVLDGFEATRQIRKHEVELVSRRTPIVALTAHVFGVSSTEWRAAGMDAVLMKPFTLDQLQKCLEGALLNAVPANAPVMASAEAKSEASPLIDHVKLDEIARFAGKGAKEFLARIVQLYIEHAPKAAAGVRAAAKEGIAEEQAKAAHSLKSMSLNIAAVAVASLAGRLEAQSKLGHPIANEDLHRLDDLVGRSCKELKCEAA